MNKITNKNECSVQATSGGTQENEASGCVWGA